MQTHPVQVLLGTHRFGVQLETPNVTERNGILRRPNGNRTPGASRHRNLILGFTEFGVRHWCSLFSHV